MRWEVGRVQIFTLCPPSQRSKIGGCTSYQDRDLFRKSMACRNFTIQPGEVLYMPKGTIHHAITGGVDSVHLTISIGSQDGAWASVAKDIAYNKLGKVGVCSTTRVQKFRIIHIC